MLILISSAHKRSGLLYQQYKEHYGKNDADVLVVRGATLQLNPTFDTRVIERQIASDPQLYRAEYLSEWHDDLANFIGRDLLEASADVGVLVRPPVTNTRYFACVDPSGGSHDSFHLGHFGADVVDTAFAKVGITYRHSDADRSAIYLDCLPHPVFFTIQNAARMLCIRRATAEVRLEHHTTNLLQSRARAGSVRFAAYFPNRARAVFSDLRTGSRCSARRFNGSGPLTRLRAWFVNGDGHDRRICVDDLLALRRIRDPDISRFEEGIH
jgi:hypothetical protein